MNERSMDEYTQWVQHEDSRLQTELKSSAFTLQGLVGDQVYQDSETRQHFKEATEASQNALSGYSDLVQSLLSTINNLTAEKNELNTVVQVLTTENQQLRASAPKLAEPKARSGLQQLLAPAGPRPSTAATMSYHLRLGQFQSAVSPAYAAFLEQESHGRAAAATRTNSAGISPSKSGSNESAAGSVRRPPKGITDLNQIQTGVKSEATFSHSAGPRSKRASLVVSPKDKKSSKTMIAEVNVDRRPQSTHLVKKETGADGSRGLKMYPYQLEDVEPLSSIMHRVFRHLQTGDGTTLLSLEFINQDAKEAASDEAEFTTRLEALNQRLFSEAPTIIYLKELVFPTMEKPKHQQAINNATLMNRVRSPPKRPTTAMSKLSSPGTRRPNTTGGMGATATTPLARGRGLHTSPQQHSDRSSPLNEQQASISTSTPNRGLQPVGDSSTMTSAINHLTEAEEAAAATDVNIDFSWDKFAALERKAELGPMARRKRILGLPMREKEKLSFVTDCPPGVFQWTLNNKVVNSAHEYLTTSSSQATKQGANLVHVKGSPLPFFQTKGSQELPEVPMASQGGAEWVCLDFRPWVITVESYAMASYHPIHQGPVPRNWELQCSMDGVHWKTLREHKEDDTISGDSDFGVWDIPPPHRPSTLPPRGSLTKGSDIAPVDVEGSNGEETKNEQPAVVENNSDLNATTTSVATTAAAPPPTEAPKTERWPCSMLRVVATGFNSLGSTHLQVAALEVYGRILCSVPGSCTKAKASYFAPAGAQSEKLKTCPLPKRRSDNFALPAELPPEPVKKGKKGKK